MEYEIGEAESVSTAVVRAVSAVDGRDPCSLPPLTGVLDPDALNDIFDVQANGERRTGGQVSFIYSHCRVTVDNGEFLTIESVGTRPRTTGESGSGYADE